MLNTRIEAAIKEMHEDILEQLSADLLKRDEYNIQPTSTSGRDNGRDAIVEKKHTSKNKRRRRIVHCSVQESLEDKINDDASTVASMSRSTTFLSSSPLKIERL
jgi:hypothetical protein